jgi:hypothetical protein
MDSGFCAPPHVRAIQGAHSVSKQIDEEIWSHRFAIQDNIFSGGKTWNKAEFLMHHAQTCIECIKRAQKMNLLAV